VYSRHQCYNTFDNGKKREEFHRWMNGEKNVWMDGDTIEDRERERDRVHVCMFFFWGGGGVYKTVSVVLVCTFEPWSDKT
jgi:hypothetical protein